MTATQLLAIAAVSLIVPGAGATPLIEPSNVPLRTSISFPFACAVPLAKEYGRIAPGLSPARRWRSADDKATSRRLVGEQSCCDVWAFRHSLDDRSTRQSPPSAPVGIRASTARAITPISYVPLRGCSSSSAATHASHRVALLPVGRSINHDVVSAAGIGLLR